MEFEEVLANPDARKIVESIEDIGDNPEPELQEIVKSNIKELRDKFGYRYIQ